MYQEAGSFAPKEYTLKLQHVRGTGRSESRKTIGRLRVDLAAFCSEEVEPLPREVFLQLK